MKMHLPRWRSIPERQSEIHKEGGPFRSPTRNETRSDRIGLSSLAVLGLLCHSLIFWLLSFPYVYTYDPYQFLPGSSSNGLTFSTTGWQAQGVILILPGLSYLACLLPVLRKSKWLEGSMYLNVLVNLGGFLFLYGFLVLVQSGHADKQVDWLDAAYGIHLTFLFLAVICSSVSSILLGFWLRRSRKLH